MKTIIKICGITNYADASEIAKLGADILGMVLSTDSPRRVTDKRAKEISGSVRAEFGKKIGLAGVFVNEPIDRIIDLSKMLDLDFIQLSGDENALYIRSLTGAFSPEETTALIETEMHSEIADPLLPGKKIIKAVRIKTAISSADSGTAGINFLNHNVNSSVEKINGNISNSDDDINNIKRLIGEIGEFCHYILLDSYKEGLYGGTGTVLKWNYIKKLFSDSDLIIREKTDIPVVILAGGLNEQNIIEAVTIIKPRGVDASSGLEEYPGKKDLKKVREFIFNIRNLEKKQ